MIALEKKTYGNWVEAEEHAIESAKKHLELEMMVLFQEQNIEKIGEHEFVVRKLPEPYSIWSANYSVAIKVEGVKHP